MGTRLSKITTKTGDDGTTGLADGSRRMKSDLRIEVIGDVDELNSILGLIDLGRATQHDSAYAELVFTQHRLFDLGAELSTPDACRIEDADVLALERATTELTGRLPPLKEFILPGGGEQSATLHLARAVCRRAERHLVKLAESEHVNEVSLRYLNRLSDYLFQLARIREVGGPRLWRPKEQPSNE